MHRPQQMVPAEVPEAHPMPESVLIADPEALHWLELVVEFFPESARPISEEERQVQVILENQDDLV